MQGQEKECFKKRCYKPIIVCFIDNYCLINFNFLKNQHQNLRTRKFLKINLINLLSN